MTRPRMTLAVAVALFLRWLATCSCGWHGPVRDTNKSHDRWLVRFDQDDHFGQDDDHGPSGPAERSTR